MTNKLKAISILLTCVSILLNIGPLCGYVIKAVLNADLVTEKIALSMTVLIVVILTVVSFVNKVALRSRLWILLIGMYLCLDSIMTPLVIIATCQVIDELLINPLSHHYKTRYKINKEIDLRGNIV